MIFSLLYIIKQLFLQIMSKPQLIQVNRFQEIMKNVDLPLVLTHPPKEVRRPEANLPILCFSGASCSKLTTSLVNVSLKFKT